MSPCKTVKIEMKAPRFVVIPTGKGSLYRMSLLNQWTEMEFNDWLCFWRELLVIGGNYCNSFCLGKLFERSGLPLNENLELGENGFMTEPLTSEEHCLKIYTTIDSKIVEKKLKELLIRLEERKRWEETVKKAQEEGIEKDIDEAFLPEKEHDATEDLPRYEEQSRDYQPDPVEII